ncbi:Biopolymer transport protein ExbD [Fuerstiella marisgermanici]|uniref:Biopolymer transport protein ExbD n=2 Tax=Fuerstiella marisgermanici TaxID=1891926 RepID=A0A1P8WMF7_9PLAN|nr:Biopolymer transport protein ExbD [Fuerstiella marisgermanici]
MAFPGRREEFDSFDRLLLGQIRDRLLNVKLFYALIRFTGDFMKIKSSGSSPPDVDMTPMIDIVFQLIAFFMVITNFEQQQADERVTLPKDQLAKPPEVKRENTFTINLGFDRDKEGEITNTTPFIFFAGEKFEVEASATKLRQESQFYQTIGTPLEDVTVEIRADADVSSGLVQKLIQMCQEQEIGFQRFALKATQKS